MCAYKWANIDRKNKYRRKNCMWRIKSLPTSPDGCKGRRALDCSSASCLLAEIVCGCDTLGVHAAEHLFSAYLIFLSCREPVYQRLKYYKFLVKNKIMVRYHMLSLFSACISGNKLGSAHHCCLASRFPVSCCTSIGHFLYIL